MKILLSRRTIISSVLGTVIAFGGFSPKTAKAQTTLYSVPEIGWSTRLSNFELGSQNIGQVFTFSCTAASYGVEAPVWGTDIYTVNSGLCQAGVHAGMISQEGGLINVELRANESDYHGSERFGVKSQTYQGAVYSLRFMGNPIAIKEQHTQEKDQQNQPRRRPSVIERTVQNGVRRGLEKTISDSIRDIFR